MKKKEEEKSLARVEPNVALAPSGPVMTDAAKDLEFALQAIDRASESIADAKARGMMAVQGHSFGGLEVAVQAQLQAVARLREELNGARLPKAEVVEKRTDEVVDALKHLVRVAQNFIELPEPIPAQNRKNFAREIACSREALANMKVARKDSVPFIWDGTPSGLGGGGGPPRRGGGGIF